MFVQRILLRTCANPILMTLFNKRWAAVSQDDALWKAAIRLSERKREQMHDIFKDPDDEATDKFLDSMVGFSPQIRYHPIR